MNRIALLAFACTLVACGGSDNGTGPASESFSGAWAGNAYPDASDSIQFKFNSIQNGSALSGSGILIESNGDSVPMVFSGTLTPPTLGLAIAVGNTTLTYTGTYITSDSISGFYPAGNSSVPLSLTKRSN